MAQTSFTQKFLVIYSCSLTAAFAFVITLGARRPSPNASFDQITVHRINIVEPDGTTRMVLSDKAEFPGAYFHGKEYPRTDRDAAGVTHSWGHLSFDEYERDQTAVVESSSDGDSRNTYYTLNDDERPYSLTPQFSAEWQHIKAMSPGPERVAASEAWHAKYPGGIVNRAYFGRGRDKSVSLSLKDQQGQERLVARVLPDGTPILQFLNADGTVTRSITGVESIDSLSSGRSK